MNQNNGKALFKVSALALAVAGTTLLAACNNSDNNTTSDTTSTMDTDTQALTRLATVPLGAEITGLFTTEEGDLFFNVQHPSSSNTVSDADGKVFTAGTVGVIRDADFSSADLAFDAVEVPSGDDQQLVRTAVGSYNVIAQNGDQWAGAPTGSLGAISTADGSSVIKVSNDPDFNAFISTGTNEGYLFTNWEDRPGGMSRLKIRKLDSGDWSVVDNDVMMVDFSSVDGTWVNCFGTLSPWMTPLTSEELYFDDTSDWNNPGYTYISDVEALQTYLGGTYPNPYNYGFIVEIQDPTTATPTPVKMRAMGRFSHENSVVMPDKKTAYMSDDGTGTIFFKFVADTAEDLSAGTLYAAKVTQDSTTDPTKAGFDIQWVELGHGDNATINGWIANYDGIDQGSYSAGSTSYISDTEINDWAESKLQQDLDSSGSIAANPFGDDRVAFLETRKAAAALGATAEFRKMEGVNINLAGAADGSVPYAYMSMSEFNKTMSDGTGAIQLDPTNADCGAVYQMALGTNFNITRMEPVLVGGPYDGTATANTCSVDNVANPDNLLVLNDGRVVVGEDSGEHENNMLWLLNPEL
ncbi:cell surface protein [Marinobacter santoriniensis NKSG1]|uniref:Cell surface protein n=2 Tax=Marinobacter santoriniensis TaxID=523742 RepID=M7DEM5_9GAMM|nr:cell surface protein [Marinobacter santoriniensis NKSG1]